MKYIIQHANDTQKDILEAVKATNQEYANKFGFEYITDSSKRVTDRPDCWEKIALLNELLPTLEEGSLVAWEDADSLNLGDESFELPSSEVFGMVPLRHGMGGLEIQDWFNSGVMVFINNALSRDFLTRCWDFGGKTDEEGIMGEYRHANRSIGEGKKIFALDPKWNCWLNNQHICRNPVILTFHGMKPNVKVAAIEAVLRDI